MTLPRITANTVEWAGRDIALSTRQIAIVRLLTDEPGRFFNYTSVHNAFRGTEATRAAITAGAYGCARTNIARIRAAFLAVDPKFDKIETRSTVGWRWRA